MLFDLLSVCLSDRSPVFAHFVNDHYDRLVSFDLVLPLTLVHRDPSSCSCVTYAGRLEALFELGPSITVNTHV